jgi:uncharacterized membrane protein
VDTARMPGSMRQRIVSVDILRGLVIVLMVLDHVRDFLHVSAYDFDPLDPARTTAIVYATRWVTHFCAPTFVFLAGASAWLQHARGKGRAELARFLVTRGLWLVVLELTVLGFGWSFSLPYLLFLQVIWAIGCGMVLLAALLWLPRAAVLAVGVAIIAGHDLLDGIAPAPFSSASAGWTLLYLPGVISHAQVPLALVIYPILPWFGVMALGYALGQTFIEAPARRDRTFALLGVGMIVVFLLLRGFNLYGDPRPWAPQPTLGQSLMAFLNVQKYPPSLLYVCATLGPVLALVPLIERWRGVTARVFLTFGAVPLFLYVVHVYVVHAVAILLRLATGQSIAGLIDNVRVIVLQPQLLRDNGFSLPVVYLVWIAVLALLYLPCRWFAGVRQRGGHWWLSYL